MKVTGLVTRVTRYSSSHGSRYTKLVIRTETGSDISLTYLQTFTPIPGKGDHVTVEGMPLMISPRRGGRRTNIGAVTVNITDKEDK